VESELIRETDGRHDMNRGLDVHGVAMAKFKHRFIDARG